MGQFWKIHTPLKAHIDEPRSRMIRAGDVIEEVIDMEEGMVRVHWPESTEGMGMVNVSRAELEQSADRLPI